MPETRDPALRDRARPRRVGGRWRHICGILDWSTRTPRRDVRREPSARRPARFLLATRHALRQPDRLPARPPRSLAEIPNIGLGPVSILLNEVNATVFFDWNYHHKVRLFDDRIDAFRAVTAAD